MIRPVLLAAVSCAALTACPGPHPPLRTEEPPSPPPPIRIPEGCEADQSGELVHAESPSFRYLATDDGGTLLLALRRARGDAGPSEPEAATRIELHRTPRGFVGTTHGTGLNAAGRACPVEFPTEVLACPDAGLVLRSAASASIGESCQPPDRPAPPAMVEHRLVREGHAWPKDAGAAP